MKPACKNNVRNENTFESQNIGIDGAKLNNSDMTCINQMAKVLFDRNTKPKKSVLLSSNLVQ